MNLIKNITIRSKMLLIILIVSVSVITACFTAIWLMNIHSLETDLRNRSLVNARLIGEYCITPLAFQDREGVQDILSRLKSIPSITSGYILDANGAIFAEFGNVEELQKIQFPEGSGVKTLMHDNHFHVYHPIHYQGKRYGAVHIMTSDAVLTGKTKSQMTAMILLLLFSILLAYILAVQFQSIISSPILNLADIARKISKDADYEIGSSYTGEDEIGILYQSFREMLSTIRTREHELNRAITAVKTSEDKYRGYIDNAPEGVLIIDKHGKLLDVNEAAIRFTGYSRKRLCSIGLQDLAYPIGTNAVNEFLKTSEQTGRGSLEIRVQTREPGEKYWAMEAVRLNDGTLLTFCKDISGLVAAEKEKEKIQFQLLQSQKMEAVGRLAGGVAHDFNNLLTVIQGNTEYIMLDIPPDNQIHEELSQIISATKKAAKLTQQLLIFSRKQTMEFKSFNLNLTVMNLLKMLERLIGEDVKCETFLDPELGLVNGDESNFEQLLINLAVNARDAMPGGGKLTIRTSNTELSAKNCQGLLSDLIPGKYVLLEIIDTGTGIDPAIVEHIFEPFFSTKEIGKGTGLGLSVVHGIVKEHNGCIDVVSQQGVGSVFRVYIPVIKSEEHKPENPEDENLVVTGQNRRILLIEDEDDVRNFMKRLFRNNNFKVFDASNGSEALALFAAEKGHFDLVFSDVVLPDQNGIDLYYTLKNMNPDLPVIFSSGYADEKSSASLILRKGYPFLQKPFDLNNVLKLVSKVLEL